MKIIIITRHSPEKRTLVDLSNRKLIDEVKMLINNGMRKEAVEKALEKGNVIKELSEDDFGLVKANFILTENSVHYDLM